MKHRSIFFLLGLLGAALVATAIQAEKTLATISDEDRKLFDGLKAKDIQLFRDA